MLSCLMLAMYKMSYEMLTPGRGEVKHFLFHRDLDWGELCILNNTKEEKAENKKSGVNQKLFCYF